MNEPIGPYRMTREIGRGGMGVVYLARDTRLDRDVAIKALPEPLAADPERLDRFEREARTLAQLNHPNIAGIHGVEEHEGARYLVLEYVEGETLAERIARGPLPADEAVEIAVEIAAGVEAAHEAGVIHRDLKPGNVIVTPEGKAKVLDFGLARSHDPATSSDALTRSPTLTSPARHSPTIPGAILGTAAYMSPEQARGRKVDKRTDVWSFGIVLYEMLTGASPFHGETVSDSIGAVLHKDVDLDRLPSETPPSVVRVLRRCLARESDVRYHSIADAALDLVAVDDEAAPARPARRLHLLAAVGAGAALTTLVAALAWVGLALEPAPREDRAPRRFQIAGVKIPSDPFAAVALSPDGTLVAVRERIHGVGPILTLHDLRSGERRPIGDRWAGGWAAEFSPDGRQLMAYSQGELKLVEVRSGATRTVAVPPSGFNGGCWMDDGSYLFTRGGDNHGIVWSDDGRSILTSRRVGVEWSVFSVPADGAAEATRLSEASLPRAVNGEPLPDGSGVLVAVGLDSQRSDIGILRFATGELELLLESAADEDGPALSPDGSVLAYWSDESGRPQVYIRRFPKMDQRIQISSEGGKEPSWSDDGTTLYFKSGERIMSVEVATDPVLRVTPATLVLDGVIVEGGLGMAGYDVSPDGSRIVVARTTDPDRADAIQIVTDWTGLLPRQAAAH